MIIEKPYIVVQHLNILRKLDLLKTNFNLDSNWRYIRTFIDIRESIFKPDSFLYNNRSKEIFTIKLLFIDDTNRNYCLDHNIFYECFKDLNLIILDYNDLNDKELLLNLKSKLNDKYNMKNILIQKFDHRDDFNSIIKPLVAFQKTRDEKVDIQLREQVISSNYNKTISDHILVDLFIKLSSDNN